MSINKKIGGNFICKNTVDLSDENKARQTWIDGYFYKRVICK